MQSFADRDTALRCGVATAAPPPPPSHVPRRRSFTIVAITGTSLSVLVLIGLLADLSGAFRAFGALGGQPTSTSALPTATTAPSSTSAPSIPGSPQGCGTGGVAPGPPSYLIYSARNYASAHGEVALTFDDGPSPIYTRQILDELKVAGAKATFFDVGAHAQRYPDLVREELASGNAVGNHTFTHQDLAGKSTDDVRWQLTTTTSTLRTITGDSCLWLFRPPFGLGGFDPNVFTEAHREGFTIVIWDVWALDWQLPGTAVIAQRIISQLHSGAIILLHDGAQSTFTPDRSQTADALPAILAAIRTRALRAVTLPRLLTDAGLVRLPGAPAEPQSSPTPPSIPTVPPGSEGVIDLPMADTVSFRSA